jgi:ubiquinone/menaquinone biosynthesis C-methylase UbiE
MCLGIGSTVNWSSGGLRRRTEKKARLAQNDQYFHGQSAAEQERLQKQAEELARDAKDLFDLIGVAAGWRVVELGCGPRGCLDLLSGLVGPDGSVVGVEIDPHAVALASKRLEHARIENVEVRQGDAKATGLAPGSFDMAMARLVAVNIPEPERLVAEMVALAKPGGVVASQEADWGLCISEPPLPALDRLINVFITYARRNGMDRFAGRKVPRWLRAAGLQDVQVRPIVREYPPDNPQRTVLLQFAENLRTRLVDHKLISEAELDESVAALKKHLADPETFFLFPLMVQTWGRKPA